MKENIRCSFSVENKWKVLKVFNNSISKKVYSKVKNTINWNVNNFDFKIKKWNQKILNLFIHLFQIRTRDEFDTLLLDDKINSLIMNWKLINFKKIFSFFKGKNDFLEILNKRDFNIIIELIQYWNIKIMNTIFDLYQINNKISFKEFLENKKVGDILFLIKHWRVENIPILFKKYKIDVKDDFEKILNQKDFNQIKKIIKNTTKIEFLKILNEINFNKNYINYWWVSYTNESYWTCHLNERINKEILNWNNQKRYDLYFNNMKLWFIKFEWKRTFLALKTFYDKNWDLIFVKWWIYFIKNHDEIINSWENDIQNIKKLKVNYIRKIDLNNDLLDNY